MHSAAPPSLPPAEVRIDILRKTADTVARMDFDTWNFGDSIGFEALVEASASLEDPALLAYAHGWARAWATGRRDYRRLDCTAPGLAMVEIAERTADSTLLAALVRLAGYLRARPVDRGILDTWEHMCLIPPYGGEPLSPTEALWLADPPSGTCVDCMHFDPPFFTALGTATGSSELVEAGVEQLLSYIDVFQQEDGTFDHFFLQNVPGTFGARWGRGQGWSMLGMLDVLKNLPVSHPAREAIEDSVRRQIAGMVSYQRADGRWWCVVDDDRSGEEGSTAAFMATGFLRAIRLGILTEHELGDSARLALAACLDDLDGDAHLTNVTAAVMASTRISHYANTPRGFHVTWGQAPVVLALCEAAGAEWFDTESMTSEGVHA